MLLEWHGWLSSQSQIALQQGCMAVSTSQHQHKAATIFLGLPQYLLGMFRSWQLCLRCWFNTHFPLTRALHKLQPFGFPILPFLCLVQMSSPSYNLAATQNPYSNKILTILVRAPTPLLRLDTSFHLSFFSSVFQLSSLTLPHPLLYSFRTSVITIIGHHILIWQAKNSLNSLVTRIPLYPSRQSHIM